MSDMNVRKPMAVSTLVHNDKRSSHFVFGKEGSAAGGGGESFEMQDISKPSQRKKRRDSAGSDGEEEEEEVFVVHSVESHHTLRGIALQYRSTVRPLFRLLTRKGGTNQASK